MDSISFKATTLCKGSVKSFGKTSGSYRNKIVKLVKINSCSEKDYSAMVKLSKLWEGEDNFIDTILAKLNYSNNHREAPKSDVYILTSQIKNLGNLKPDKILGLAEVTAIDNTCSLDYLQTRPDSMYSKSERKYKHVGEYLLNYVTGKFGKKNLYLRSTENAIEFYKKYGFIIAQADLNEPLMKYKK